jgi:hypothetical protein
LSALGEVDWSPEAVWWLPDLGRVRAVLLLAQDEADPRAKDTLRQSLRTARRNGDRVSELRLTTELARLLQAGNHGAEGGERLAEVYGCFKEGVATPDLRDAKALLDEVA